MSTPAPPPNPFDRPLFRWAPSVAAALVIAAAAVWWTRGDRGDHTPPPALSDDIFTDDPLLSHRVKAGLSDAKVVTPGRPHPLPFRTDEEYQSRITRRITYHCSTNSQGLRGPDLPPAPPPGVTRVACVGDSITFGHGVEDDETYPAVLQQLLRRDGGAFDVLNAGVQGYDAPRCYTLMQERVLPMHPDVVAICVGVCDMTNAPRGDPATAHFDLVPSELQVALGSFRQHLSGMISLCRHAGIDPILMVPPAGSFFSYPQFDDVARIIRETADRDGLPLVDLRAAFLEQERDRGLTLEVDGVHQRLVRHVQGRPEVLLEVTAGEDRRQYVAEEIYAYLDTEPVSQALLIDGCHPNPEGHRLIARLLEEVIRRGPAAAAPGHAETSPGDGEDGPRGR